MKIIKFIGIWILMIITSIFMPLAVVFGYSVSLEAERRYK
jgi:hypothetical protein